MLDVGTAFQFGAVFAEDWLSRSEHKAQPCAAAPREAEQRGRQT